MSEWEKVPAGTVTAQRKDVVTLEPGVEYHTMGVRWYGRGAYGRGTGTTETIKAKRLFRAHKGDFVFNRIDTQNGAFDVVPAALDGALATNEFPLYVVDPDQLSERFLLLYFQQPSVLAQIDAMRAGSEGRSRWKEADFEAWRIPLPSLAEQRRVVDVIATVGAQIEAIAVEVERSRQAITALRSSLLEPQSHWEPVTIGDIATAATGRAFPDRFQGRTTGVLPYFKVGDMNAPGNERVLRVAPNWLTDETLTRVRPRVCPPGTVVFPIIGAALLTEKRRVLAESSAFDQNLMGLILSDRVTSDYMLAVMSNLSLGDLAQKGAVPSVNQKLVSGIRLAIPPIEEQKAIGEQVTALLVQTEASASELAHLRTFRAALLTSLLNQDIEIPESYDALLEKVF